MVATKVGKYREFLGIDEYPSAPKIYLPVKCTMLSREDIMWYTVYLYTSKHLRGKFPRLEWKIVTRLKTFMVASL